MKRIKNAKKIVALGLATSLVIAGSTVTNAEVGDAKAAQVVGFNVELNGTPVYLDDEIVAIDGRTYMPVRSVCENMLGMVVDWIPETNTVSCWNMTKPQDTGTHEFPVSTGVPVTGQFDSSDPENPVNYTITISDIMRGDSVEKILQDEWMLANPYEEDREASAQEKKEARQDYIDDMYDYLADMLNMEITSGHIKEGTMLSSTNDSLYQFLRCKVHIDIKKSPAEFTYTTSSGDFTPYCGTVVVDGLTRQFQQYGSIDPTVQSEYSYAGRTILTNGIQEGYMYFVVYRGDTQPRVMYTGGQYLALY